MIAKNKTNRKKKLVIIGIDGGTFDIIDPLIKIGELPNLAGFKNKAILNSTMPPGTGVAWASFATGNNPGKTNIYDFTIVQDDSWNIKIVNRKILKGKTLWNYLSEAGKKSIIVNLPITYPPEEINGIMISGIDTPSTLSNYTFPSSIKNKLKEFDYEIEVSGIKEKGEMSEQAIKIIDKRIKTAEYLLKEDFDFFIILFRETDVVQHFAWGTEKVTEAYKKIDNFIGELKKMSKKNNFEIIIMSDHGHEKVNHAFNVNSWLQKEGFLKTINKKTNIMESVGINREKIFNVLDKLKLNFLVKIVPRKLGKKIPTKNIDFEEAIITGIVDLKNTKAIAKRAVKTAQIFINKESRGGIVKNAEEAGLISEIVNKLKMFFEYNNIKAIIKTKKELYGEKANLAPDITVYMEEKEYDIQTRFVHKDKIWDETKEQATHNTEGIILSDIDLNLENARIIDMAPTILKYFGIKTGKFDGKSLL
ncbi:alkaline phosphatase family protein [Candidatus Pacearchaeota archaeon]|nr:alkaline phosphatase family protein [Candidatus Pacearchaeota archaeon]